MKRTVCLLAVGAVAMTSAVCVPAANRRGGQPSEAEVAKIKAAAPEKATAKPAKPRKLLVLSYRSHQRGRMAGEKALEIMAEQTGAYTPEFVREESALPEVVMPEKLRQYDAVCVNNSTGGGGKAKNGKTLVENLDAYVREGGGLVGIHSATDNKFGAVFGGFFSGHPWHEQVGVKVDDPAHPLCKAFGGKGFLIRDEIYQFTKIYTRDKLHVLLSLDMNRTRAKGRRKDNDYAVAWVKTHGKGRVFYCSLGHDPHIFWEPKLLRFYLDGIQFALGDIDADTTPSAKLAEQPKAAPAP